MTQTPVRRRYRRWPNYPTEAQWAAWFERHGMTPEGKEIDMTTAATEPVPCPLCGQDVQIIDGRYGEHDFKTVFHGDLMRCAASGTKREDVKLSGADVFARIKRNNS